MVRVRQNLRGYAPEDLRDQFAHGQPTSLVMALVGHPHPHDRDRPTRRIAERGELDVVRGRHRPVGHAHQARVGVGGRCLRFARLSLLVLGGLTLGLHLGHHLGGGLDSIEYVHRPAFARLLLSFGQRRLVHLRQHRLEMQLGLLTADG